MQRQQQCENETKQFGIFEFVSELKAMPLIGTIQVVNPSTSAGAAKPASIQPLTTFATIEPISAVMMLHHDLALLLAQH